MRIAGELWISRGVSVNGAGKMESAGPSGAGGGAQAGADGDDVAVDKPDILGFDLQQAGADLPRTGFDLALYGQEMDNATSALARCDKSL